LLSFLAFLTLASAAPATSEAPVERGGIDALWQAVGGRSPPVRGGFNPARDIGPAVLCDSVYTQLADTARRLPDRRMRTDGAIQAFRGSARTGPLLEAARKALGEPALDNARGVAGLLLGAAAGYEEQGDTATDPHLVETRLLRQVAARCDVDLATWGLEAPTGQPPDVARFGYAEFQVSGKSAGNVFPDPATEALATAACEEGADGVARAVASGANPKGRGLDGTTPLLWAIACENLSGLSGLLEGGADPNEAVEGLGSAVVVAAGYRNPEILRRLLAAGGDPDAADDRRTALMEAFSLGVHDAGWTNYEILLAAGADISRRGPDGDTIVDEALMLRRYEAVLDLLDRGYAGDLVALGRYVSMDEEMRQSILKERWLSLDKLHKALEQRGIRFPVPPLAELKRDARGHYVQP
jgi:uncharacterized protein